MTNASTLISTNRSGFSMTRSGTRSGLPVNRFRRALRPALVALAAGLTLVACGGGGGGGKKKPNPLAVPDGVVAFPGDGEVTLSWTPNATSASYNIYWSTLPGLDKATANQILDAKAPFLHTGLTNLTEYYYAVTSLNTLGTEGNLSPEVKATPRTTAGQFAPPWGGVAPTNTIQFDYDDMQTPEANGTLLATQIGLLSAGTRLEISDGVWSLPDPFSIDLVGTAMAPIWIANQPGHRPTLTRADASGAVVQVGANTGARYLALIGLEIADGGRGFDLFDAQEIWLDLNLLSRGGNTPIAADNFDTQALYITRNQLDHAGGQGHGIVLGLSDATVVSSGAVIAQNHVAFCRGTDATGIWVRQGSYDNWIVENFVHDTDWPCILVAGTGTQPWNTIERNMAFTSVRDNVIEVQSQAFVRNNLMIDGNQGFSSHDDFAAAQELEVTHNTIINDGRAASLSDWSNKPGLVFANNVSYSLKSDAIRFVDGFAGVTFEGNVVFGNVKGPVSGFTTGNGLADFIDMTWKATKRDATPSAGSPIIDAAGATYHAADDLSGLPRDATTMEAGCVDVL